MGGGGSTSARTIAALLEGRARRAGSSPALLAPGRPALDSRGLARLVREAREPLRAAGVGPSHRVALALPDGPATAAAFLAVAASASAAPLNPASTGLEMERGLRDLDARAVIVPPGADGAAREAAARLGIPVLRLEEDAGAAAGEFLLVPEGRPRRGRRAAAGAPRPAGEALVLPTSGTTSRPKLVPLSHRNLLASARSIARSLSLGPRDRCLCVMPLFHVHGLVGSVLATVSSGGAVACTPGHRAPEFFRWVAEMEPTWYTAVPTMHQSILERAAMEGVRPGGHTLRFARSASSALPSALQARLEEALGIPLLQAYGMTEASHQIAVNPLPPRERKPGSVGRPAGAEVRILDDGRRALGPGAVGEVALRGPCLTKGYSGDAAATRKSFHRGWFLTGDRGFLDADGYLFLSGRTKELINRGGEKVSPVEVDEALGAHPAVAQALAFALPHPRLGEDVGAAVVLRAGAAATERQILDFAAARLARHKVPARILFLDALPKGPTGKPRRIGLAGILGVGPVEEAPAPGAAPAAAAPPATASERRLAAHLRGVLRVDAVGVTHRFEELGLDSLTAVGVAEWIRSSFDPGFEVRELFELGTVRAVAARLDAGARP